MITIDALKLAMIIFGLISAGLILLVVWLIGFFKAKNDLNKKEQEEQF